MLITQDLKQIRESLREALGAEKVNLDRLRQKVRQLKVIELGYRQCYAVAPVATDGGENNLSLEPMNVEIVRVVDSDGVVHFQEFLPLSSNPEELGERLFQSGSILGRLIEALQLSNWRELSYLYFSAQEQLDPEAMLAISDTRRFIKVLRDVLEWAALVELASQSGRPVFLLIRDGLLRTKFIKKQAFSTLAAVFQQAYNNNRKAMIVGVAKRSKALNYLSLALTLEEVFNRQKPCFVEVPRELEQEAYTWARTWMEGQSFGRLHLVKLVEGPDALILPVDIPEWLMARRNEVFEYLAETAKSSFPVPGYPYPLVRAHENANLSGLEMEFIGDMMSRALIDLVEDKDKEKTLRYISLGRGLVKGGKHYGE